MKNGFMIFSHLPQTNPANGVALLLSASSYAPLAQKLEGTTAGQEGLWLVCDYARNYSRAIQTNMQRNDANNIKSASNPVGKVPAATPFFATRQSETRTGGSVLA
jgi:hypothetical protein